MRCRSQRMENACSERYPSVDSGKDYRDRFGNSGRIRDETAQTKKRRTDVTGDDGDDARDIGADIVTKSPYSSKVQSLYAFRQRFFCPSSTSGKVSRTLWYSSYVSS